MSEYGIATNIDGEIVEVVKPNIDERVEVLENDIATKAENEIVATGSITPRSLSDRFADVVNVNDFGAVGDGVTDDTVAIQSMIAEKGYALFSTGQYAVTTTTFDAPLHFLPGASLIAGDDANVTITSSIDSPRQYIFQGDGNYILRHDDDSGENARQIHVSWFGAFPSPSTSFASQSNFIQRALSAVGNERESVVVFDVGNYVTDKTMYVGRCTCIKGQGTRRTVFKQKADGYSVFETANVGVKFEGVQFENINKSSVRQSPYIRILHDQCEIYDFAGGASHRNIEINANSCRINNVVYAYSSDAGTPDAGSSIIAVRGGFITINNILCMTTSSVGPEAIIDIGADIGANALDCSGITISGITYFHPSKAIKIHADNCNVSRVIVDKINFNGWQSTKPANLIDVSASGSNNIRDIIVKGVVATSALQNGISVVCNTTGVVEDISIDSFNIDAVSGSAIILQKNSGTMRDITIGSNVNIGEANMPISYSSGISNLRINATAYPNAKPATTWDYTINDDGFVVVDFPTSIFTGILMVSVASANYWLGTMRCAPSPTGTTIHASANMATRPNALTGTTGDDGKFTIGFQDKKLYLENRLGSSQRVAVTVMTGVA